MVLDVHVALILTVLVLRLAFVLVKLQPHQALTVTVPVRLTPHPVPPLHLLLLLHPPQHFLSCAFFRIMSKKFIHLSPMTLDYRDASPSPAHI